ncbi:MAG: hypothetical protein IJQ73_14865 [Kiritimatiellae bacterium]|nr:hypothetical protein [Kiritimatiellia bacterium]
MKTTKAMALCAMAAVAAAAHAGTYTWTGAANDGLWFTPGNWNLDGVAAATSPGNEHSDDVVINGSGVAVSYDPGGDWVPTGSTTISGGASLTQINGAAWPLIRGNFLLDGGSYDTGSAGAFRLASTMTIQNGGVFTLRTGQQNIDGTGRIVLAAGGTIERTGEWQGTIPVTFQGGEMTVAGVYTSNDNDLYEGGAITATGEFHPHDGLTIDGTVITCSLYSPQGADRVVTFVSGGLVCTSSGFDGYYQNAGVYIDIPAGSTATFTMPVAAANVYNAYFTNGKFRYNGETVSQADFEELFSVEAVDESHARFALANAAPVYALTAPTAYNVSSSSATLSTTLRKVGEGAGTVVFSYATSASAIDLANGGFLGAAAVEGAVFSTNLTGLVADTLYHYAFGVVTGNVVVAQTEVKTFFASDYSAIFLGGAGDGLAATAGNWSSGSVPTDSDTILIKADCTWLPGNLNLANWNVTVDGAALTVNGEVNQTAARTLRNGALSAIVFVGSGNAIEVRGSDITATTTGRWNDVPRGFYATAPFFNFHSGAPCSYTYAYNPEGDAPDAEAEFTALFTNGRILVDGAVLTDASRVTITTNTTDHTMTATLLASVVTASFEDAASATVNGLSATLSVTVEVGGGHALYALVGDDPANLTVSLVAAEAADATTYTFAATGAEGALTYYQFRLGDGADAIYDSLTPQSFFATADGNVWLGTVSALASVPANWSKGTVPGASDAVYVVKEKAIHDLEWNIADATVASWKQIGDVSVTFLCTPSNLLSIAGNATLDGGTWTHAGPAANPSTMINVAVGGDLTVGADASIQAGTAAGGQHYRSRGFEGGFGPGFKRDAGGSYAGDGGHPSNIVSFVSYGSILDPLSYGSGGWGDSELYAGGGIVKLAVGGTLTVNGTICSRGFGWPLDQENTIGGAGSGGSVNITAGALAGTGSIDANGGNNGLLGPGSGGRVKVALTGANASFATFDGTISAYGGSMQNEAQAVLHDVSPAAAGTVCLVAPGAKPVVLVDNVWRYGNTPAEWRVAAAEDAVPSGTHLPAMQDTDRSLLQTRWQLVENGAIRLTADARVASLSIASAEGAQCVYTDGHTLSVKELVVGETRKSTGTYTAADLPGVIAGSGAVVVEGSHTVILLR